MTKIIRVTKCDDPDCPFFERTLIYDYNDVCTCRLSDRKIDEFVTDSKSLGGFKDVSGIIPDWCELEELDEWVETHD